MHSSASRAANGMRSAKRPCEDPNRSFISEARNEPRASAARAVIMPFLQPTLQDIELAMVSQPHIRFDSGRRVLNIIGHDVASACLSRLLRALPAEPGSSG